MAPGRICRYGNVVNAGTGERSGGGVVSRRGGQRSFSGDAGERRAVRRGRGGDSHLLLDVLLLLGHRVVRLPASRVGSLLLRAGRALKEGGSVSAPVGFQPGAHQRPSPRKSPKKGGRKRPDQSARSSLVAPVRHELFHQAGDGGFGAVLGEVPHRELERERYPRRGARPDSSSCREESNSSSSFPRAFADPRRMGPSTAFADPPLLPNDLRRFASRIT